MPLFLKNIAPELDIFGNRQLFNFNKDSSSGERDSALSLINWFTPILNVNANSTFEFLTPAMKGFRFNHSLSTTGTFGNFSFEKYDRFGLATPLWGYDEQIDNLNFLKNLDLLTNDLRTTGTINAQTGTLKGNNLAAHNSSSIGVLNTLAMNSNHITGLANPINTQDAATKQYVDNSSGGAPQSILHGYNISTYNTNIYVGDHIKFDGVVFVRGSNVSLDTSSSYTTSTNVASVGRITLAAGKTYKLTGSINNVVSANYNAMRWYNSDTGATLGVQSGMSSPISTINRVPSAGFVAYITTSVSTRVELRITWNALSSVNGTADAIGPTWFTVEEV